MLERLKLLRDKGLTMTGILVLAYLEEKGLRPAEEMAADLGVSASRVLAARKKIREIGLFSDLPDRQCDWCRVDFTPSQMKQRYCRTCASEANDSSRKAATRQWLKHNKDAVKAYRKAYVSKDPARARSRFIRNLASKRAKMLGVPCTLTSNDILDLYRTHEKCAMCDALLDHRLGRGARDKALSPSLDRLIPQKGYTLDNVRVVCHRCNRLKSDMSQDDLVRLVAYMEGIR